MESIGNNGAAETMTAVVHHGYGAPRDVLDIGEVATPRPGAGQVLVRVRAAGAAIGDWLTVTGTPYVARPSYGLRRPKQEVAGYEMAGTVVAVGPDVTEFAPGDEVFGWGNGTFAEYTLSDGPLAHKPQSLSFEEAAAVPVSALTALQGLRDAGGVEPGKSTLIVGASGAVGTFAVQIAKALGAEVTAVCSTRNVDLVRSLGADHVIDYTKEAIGAGGNRYDVIVDIAGNRSLAELRQALAPTGTLVIVGGSGGKWLMGFDRTIRAGILSPFVKQTLRPFISKPNHEDLLALCELIEAGKVRPVIDQRFALADTVEAMQYLGERHTRGKTVITV